MAQASWEEVVVTALACALRLYGAPDLSPLLHEARQDLARGCIMLRLRCFWSGHVEAEFLRQNLLKCATPASTSCMKSAGCIVSVRECIILIFRGRVQRESTWQSGMVVATCKHTLPACFSIYMYYRHPTFPYGML